MATITPEIAEVIRLAKLVETEASKLDSYKAEKVTHQNAIAGLNGQITVQTTVVQDARIALKAAANLI